MIRHLLQLVWNRKRQNLLLAFEIFLSFLVLFAVVLLFLSSYYNWRQPLGFDITRVWTIRIGYPLSGPMDQEADTAQREARVHAAETLRRVYAALEDVSNVEQVAASWPSVPYGRGGWRTGLREDRVSTDANMATDDFADVVGLRLSAGRWFSADDNAGAWVPAVITERLAHELFADQNPIDREFPSTGALRQRGPIRVVGVIADFRQEGEFAEPRNYAFFRLREDDPTASVLPNSIVIKVEPGTTAALEPTILETLEGIAPDWSFEIQPADVLRDSALERAMTPLIVLAIVAAFLLVMVALGLTGVVWQSVATRIQEFGLRRAKGATVPNVRHQVLSELALTSTLALCVGVALVAQLPLLPLYDTDFPPPPILVWVGSIAVSVAVIYLLTLTSAWYPSRLATTIQPAEALHYE